MSLRNILSWWILLMGLAFIFVGTVHNLATDEVYKAGYDQLPGRLGQIFKLLFILAGSAVIYCGLIVAYSSFWLRKSQFWAWIICLSAGIFMLIFGAPSVMIMPGNPFAWILLIAAGAEILPLLIFFPQFIRREKA
jgi:hypothetical protein